MAAGDTYDKSIDQLDRRDVMRGFWTQYCVACIGESGQGNAVRRADEKVSPKCYHWRKRAISCTPRIQVSK